MERKSLRAIAFSASTAVVWLQCLDGIGAGIYGVAVVAFSAALKRGKGGFNTLTGLFATALAVGRVIGLVLSGILVERLDFTWPSSLHHAIAKWRQPRPNAVVGSARRNGWRGPGICGAYAGA